MIIKSKAPCRLSLFGGGTDFHTYFEDHGGFVVSMAINLREKITLYTEDNLFDIPINQIPPSGNIEFLHRFFTEFNMGSHHFVRFISESDIPLESGMGASAATGVAVVGAINTAKNLNLSLEEIAERTWDIEVNKIGLFGGRQDQYAAAFGGVNIFEFSKLKVDITPLGRNFIEKLLPSIILFYVGKNRQDPKIQEGFKKLSPEQIKYLHEIKQIALKAVEPITKGDIEEVGHLLDRSWRAKQRANKGVTLPWINKLYEKGKSYGALGGKVCGAGGGGFMFFIVKPNKKEEFINKMEKEGLAWYDFTVDWNGLSVLTLKR